MDELRDIQSSNFSKILDVETRTDPFGDNRSGDRAYRRAERVVAALILLTNHIDSADILRKQVRANSLILLDEMLSLRDEMRTSNSAKVNEIQGTVRSLISQTRMLVFAGFVSTQNAEALCGALDDLGAFLTLSQRTPLSEKMLFSKEQLLHVRENHKGHLRDIKDRANIKDKRTETDNSQPAPETSIPSPILPSARGSGILDVLRAGGDMNIKDIAANLPEYGEKTIQRELNILIERGVVRRTGLKRWSRYLLA